MKNNPYLKEYFKVFGILVLTAIIAIIPHSRAFASETLLGTCLVKDYTNGESTYGVEGATFNFNGSCTPPAGTTRINMNINYDDAGSVRINGSTVHSISDNSCSIKNYDVDVTGKMNVGSSNTINVNVINSNCAGLGADANFYFYGQTQQPTNPTTPPTQGTNPATGYADETSCSHIGGWASDIDSPNNPVTVKIYKDGPINAGTFVTSFLANQFRSDVGNKAFGLTTPTSLTTGGSHSVYIYAVDNENGTNTLLGNSPRTISCATNPPVPPVPPTPQAPTITLTANPSAVSYGGSSVLTWSSTNATACYNSWNGGNSLSGTYNTGALTTTTNYTVSCSNSVGSASDSTTVTVGTQPPVNNNMSGTLTPSAYSCYIYAGQSSCNINFNWNTINPVATSSVTSSSWTEAYGNTGSQSFSIPYGSKTFYLYNNAVLLDQDTVSATCAVGAYWNGYSCETTTITPPPIYNNLSVTTSTATNISSYTATINGYVSGNSSSNTAWFEWGTNSGSLYNTTNQNYYGSSYTNYSANITGLYPNTRYYYRAAARGSNGTTVYGSVLSFTTTYNYVNPPIYTPPVYTPPVYKPPVVNNNPTVTIYADDTSLSYNGATTIRWNTANATSCTGTGGSTGWSGNKNLGPSSFYTGSLTGTRTYSINCTNGYGSISNSVTVNVRARTTTSTTTQEATSYLIVNSSVDRNQPIVPTLDNTNPRPGDEITYTINYQNIGTGSIRNLVLRLNLPREVDYMFSNPSNPSTFGDTLTFNLGTLGADKQGTVTVRVRVRNEVNPGAYINFPATLSYTDASGRNQSIDANVSAQVWTGDSNTGFFGASAFGSGAFLPGNLFGWLLLIILILLLVMLAKYLYNLSYSNRYVAAYPPLPPYDQKTEEHSNHSSH